MIRAFAAGEKLREARIKAEERKATAKKAEVPEMPEEDSMRHS